MKLKKDSINVYLKTHINNSIFRKILLKIEKIVKIFLILDKLSINFF